MTQVKTTLPESLMKAIELVTQSDLPAVQRLEATILICHGWGLWEQHEGSFDPTSYAVPDAQWTQIADWLQSGQKGSDIDKVNLTLSFMNSGPSGYKEV